MSEHEEHEHAHHEHEERSSPTWIVRMALGVGGIILLTFAFFAWQMHLNLGGTAGAVLPWVVVAAILLGAAAIIESITHTIWITLIGGIFVVLSCVVLAGRFTVEFDANAHAVFEVDRFTGETRLCSRTGCQTLPADDDAAKAPTITLPMPKVLAPQPEKH
jgi:hypothetical protein